MSPCSLCYAWGRNRMIGEELTVRTKILRFGEAIAPVLTLLPQQAARELNDALTTGQAILLAATWGRRSH